MSTIRLRDNATATWLPVPAAGKIWYRGTGEEGKGADPWLRASKVYVRNNTAANWIDTGYVANPGEPTGLAVATWDTVDYNAVQIKWVAPTTGAPVSSYETQLRAQNLTTVINTYPISATAALTSIFIVVPNTKYGAYVRSKSAAGIFSDWVGPLKIQIGKSASTTTTTDPTATRAYIKTDVGDGYRDEAVGPLIPSTVRVAAIRYQVAPSGSFTSVLSPYNNREIWQVNNGVQTAVRFSWGASVNEVVAANFIGNSNKTGYICRGVGWSIRGNSTAYRAPGTVTVTGTETYTATVTVTTPAVPNGFW